MEAQFQIAAQREAVEALNEVGASFIVMGLLGLRPDELPPEQMAAVMRAAQLAVDAGLPINLVVAAAAGIPVEIVGS